jgi:transaldolase/glucose-6-phosphate isomerase
VTLDDCLRSHIRLIGRDDYVAVLAYLEMNDAVSDVVDRIRGRIRAAKSNAVTVGFGPRFLHSTGQAHKGGPNTGVFFVLTAEPGTDVDVPGRPYPFGVVIGAQARGDCDALEERGRRVLRVHLRGEDTGAGLEALDQAFARALSGTGGSGDTVGA